MSTWDTGVWFRSCFLVSLSTCFPRQRHRNLRRHPRVVLQQRQVRPQAGFPRQRADAGQQEWRHRLAFDPLRLRLGQRLGDRGFHLIRRRLELGRDGHGHQHAARQPQRPLRAEQRRDLRGRVGAHVHRQAAVPVVERGEAIRAVAHHRHPVRLQPFQRRRQIQDRLRPRADDEDGRLRELGEIGGDVGGQEAGSWKLDAGLEAADSCRPDSCPS